MVTEIFNDHPEELGSSERLSRLSEIWKCSVQFVVFCRISLDFDKAGTLLSPVIKTSQSESVQARISYNNKLHQSFNGLKQQRRISVAQASTSIVDWQAVFHNPSELRNGLRNPSESRMVEGPLFLIL